MLLVEFLLKDRLFVDPLARIVYNLCTLVHYFILFYFLALGYKILLLAIKKIIR